MKKILALLLTLFLLLTPLHALAAEGDFTDVPVTHWAFDSIYWAKEENLMKGTGDGTTFEPSGVVSRAQLVTVLWRMEGEPAPTQGNPFSDLTASWYKSAVIWANEAGVVKGTGDGTTFTPNGTLTREQAATMFYRYADHRSLDTAKSADLSAFPDSADVSSWAKEGLSWANAQGLITGANLNGTVILNPQGKASRAELATILRRFDAFANPPHLTHVYDHGCDPDCNECGETRTTAHVYDNACDTACNKCGAARTAAAHVYDNACDPTCNECSATRAIAHIYDNACDAKCNICGNTRTVPAHVYTDASDTTCNVCGATRVLSAPEPEPEHLYDNDCDPTCNKCGEVRAVPDHRYDNACDATCNECSATRMITHNYDHACDTDCNVCGNIRTVPNHIYFDECDENCEECYEFRDAPHVFDSDCDTECNLCGATREGEPHIYEDDADEECNDCGEIRDLSGGNTDPNGPVANMTYEKFIALSAKEKMAFKNTYFSSSKEFNAWFNQLEADYKAAQGGIIIDGGSVDLSDYINGNT